MPPSPFHSAVPQGPSPLSHSQFPSWSKLRTEIGCVGLSITNYNCIKIQEKRSSLRGFTAVLQHYLGGLGELPKCCLKALHSFAEQGWRRSSCTLEII